MPIPLKYSNVQQYQKFKNVDKLQPKTGDPFMSDSHSLSNPPMKLYVHVPEVKSNEM